MVATINLFARGKAWRIDIRHIIDAGTTESQAELEQRLAAQLKLKPDLFEDKDDASLIERAYDIQGDRIAYVDKEDEAEKPVEAPRGRT